MRGNQGEARLARRKLIRHSRLGCLSLINWAICGRINQDQEGEMYIAYDWTGITGCYAITELRIGFGITYWLEHSMTNLACNVCVWIVPGTVSD